MLRMSKHIKDMLKEWAARQRKTADPVEMPQELKDYLDKRKRIIEKAEANGCLIG